MSANLDLVRSMHRAWARGDFSSVDWARPEIDFAFIDGPAPGEWTGVAQMAEAWSDFLGAWEGVRFEMEECREIDDARVLVLVHIRSGRGKGSGLEVRQIRTLGAELLHIKDGQVTSFVLYYDRGRAFADLGLEE